MYVEIKTNDAGELLKVFEETIRKGQRATLTFSKDGDFYSLSVNDSLETVSPDATS